MMLNLIWDIITKRSWTFTKNNVIKLRSAIVTMMMLCIGLIIIMWGINAFGGKEVNYVFFFAGGILLILQASNPRVVGGSALAGTVVQGLRDEDLTQGAVKGVMVLYRVMLGMLFGFWVLAGLLSTWSFKEAPGAFWPIAAMALTIGVTIEFFEMKGGVFKWVVIGYAVGVILVAFWQTVPTNWKSRGVTESSASAQTSSQGQSSSAKWSVQADDGAIPVGVWSESTMLPPGSNVFFDSGNGTVYQIRYRLYNSEWKIHQRESNFPQMNEIQFKAMEAGLKKIPFTIKYP